MRLVSRGAATKLPGLTLVGARPTVEIAFPFAMARLIEDRHDECAIAEALKVRPRANALNRCPGWDGDQGRSSGQGGTGNASDKGPARQGGHNSWENNTDRRGRDVNAA